MRMTYEDLRLGMAARTSLELRDIADNRGAAYSMAAIEAARTELASRSADDDSDTLSDASAPIPVHETWLTRLVAKLSGLPRILGGVLWASFLIAAVTTLGITVFSSRARSFGELTMLIGPAIIGWSIVVGILTERAYVRPVLITALAGLGAFMLADCVIGVMTNGFSFGNMLGSIVVSWCVWSWFFAFVRDEQVKAYYQRQRQWS